MSKTPVSILQELMVKKNIAPSYEWLSNSEGVGTHAPTFHYKVVAGPIQAVGTARSKKDAKHEAARLALEKLALLGMYESDTPSSFNVSSSSPLHSSSETSPLKIQVNAVGAVKTLCAERNIPQPVFQILADVGPAHLRHFTFECKVATMTVTATDLTKKKAKQLAAQKMLHRLMDTLPEELEEMSSDNYTTMDIVLTSSSDAVKSYNELSVINKKRINWGLKISEYPNSFKKIMNEKGIQNNDIWKGILNENADSLNECLARLDLQHSVDYLEQDSSGYPDKTIDLNNVLCKLDLQYTIEYKKKGLTEIVFISLSSNPQFMVSGVSMSKKKALIMAIENLYEFLQIMLK